MLHINMKNTNIILARETVLYNENIHAAAPPQTHSAGIPTKKVFRLIL